MKEAAALSVLLLLPTLFNNGISYSRQVNTPLPAVYQSYRGAQALDGDTFYHAGKRFKLKDSNAPELYQPGGLEARRDLQGRLDSGEFEYKPVARDKNGRIIVEERKRIEEEPGIIPASFQN